MFNKKRNHLRSLQSIDSEFSEISAKNNLMQEMPSDKDSQEPVSIYDIPKLWWERRKESLVESGRGEKEITTKELEIKMAELETREEVAKIGKQQAENVAQKGYDQAIYTMREVNDPMEIDVNEFKAIDVIIRNNLAGDGLGEFLRKVEEKEVSAIKDLQTLQKSLKLDGKYSGPIDEEFGLGTKSGMNALISENAGAIKSYIEAKELLSRSSTSVQSTPAVEKEVEGVQKQ